MHSFKSKLSVSTNQQTVKPPPCRLPPYLRGNAKAVTRGIPSGYLSYIEQRLLDTELVVFELLSTIYKSQIPIQPQRLSEQDRQALVDIGQKQSKSAKIEEWKSLPLVTDEHRHEWWLKRCESISPPIQSASSRLSQDTISPQDTWTDSPLSVQFEDTQVHTTLQPSASSMSQQPALVAPWQPPREDIVPQTNGAGIDDILSPTCSALVDGPGQGATTVVPIISSEPRISRNSEPLGTDRWHKYF
jgi:hypothetical protein